MSSAPPSKLPQEVIDEIVDHLKDDMPTLQALVLVSRAFLHRARTHLFATLFLQGLVNKKDGSVLPPSVRIYNIVTHAPHLLPYLQQLRILINPYPEFIDDWTDHDTDMTQALTLLYYNLNNMEAPSLSHFDLRDVMWCRLPMGLRGAFEHFLGFRTLKMITLVNILDIPWHTFELFCPDITSLFLDRLLFTPVVTNADDDWTSDDDESSPDGPVIPIDQTAFRRLRIESLGIYDGALGDDPMILLSKHTVCPLDLTHLRSFWTSKSANHSWPSQAEMFSYISHSLEKFGIAFHIMEQRYKEKTALPELDLSNCHKLRHLHVATTSLSHVLPLQAAFLWLAESVRTLPANHQLECVVVRTMVGSREGLANYGIDRSLWPEVRPGFGWPGIDWTLANPRFNSVRRFHIILCPEPGTPPPVFWALFYAAPMLLPNLISRGVVCVTVANRWLPLDFQDF